MIKLKLRKRTREVDETSRTNNSLGLMFWAAVSFLAVLTFCAIFADILPFKNPTQTFKGLNKNGPSGSFLLGNDGVGRDILSRVVYGAQTSLVIAVVGTSIALIIGGSIGLAAGYYRGKVDRLLTIMLNTTLIIPPLILFISLILFLDPAAERRMFILIFTFALLSIAPIGRVVRANTMAWSEREFVLAAQTIGARNGRVMFREILPNVAPSLISYSLIVMATLIIVEGAVAFIGLSVPSPTPTWGDMINKGRPHLDVAPHITLMPALSMFLTVLSLNFIGDKLQEKFEPKAAIL